MSTVVEKAGETAAAAVAAPRPLASFWSRGHVRTLAALALLVAYNLIFTPNFATMETLSVNLSQICVIVIVGAGMTLVIATGGIDLSVGSIMAIAGAVSPQIFQGLWFPVSNLYLGIALGIVIPIAIAVCSAFSTAGSSRASTSSRSSRH
jgi:ribose transport system permease protein